MNFQLDENTDFLSIASDEEDENEQLIYKSEMPVVPLRNTVLFPNVVMPISVSREKSLIGIQKAFKEDKLIAIFSQKDGSVENPTKEDLHTTGTVAKILKIIKLPDNTSTVFLQGKKRVLLKTIISETPYLAGQIDIKHDKTPTTDEFLAIIDSIRDVSKNIIHHSNTIPKEAEILIQNIQKPVFLMHFVASNLLLPNEEKQEILEIDSITEKANYILSILNKEYKFVELKNKIQNKTRGEIDKQQKDYFLNQQLRAIHEELGADSPDKDLQKLIERAETAKWTAQARENFDKEIGKLRRTNPSAPDYSVIYSYLETLLDLPWSEYSEDNLNIPHAKQILDEDHYNMTKIKERILEYLAVLKLKGNLKSPILCLSGPPGVGKTSLGKSIARALGRKYIRMSLGGLHDESEIRGHRKTYIGAMPGRIMQQLKKAKTANPVFILDEIDKLGKDHRGDPSSALLEVLDPEQNANFYDNYLEVEFDLSKVMFIATANYLQNIQPALRDRMEIIQVDGYSVEEKLQIATRYLVPKQIIEHGLKPTDIKLSEKTLEKLIEEYTGESGVRELERKIAALMRYRAKAIASGEKQSKEIKPEQLSAILGISRYDKTMYSEARMPGVAVGLAYTSIGGDILFIETSKSKGKGGLMMTGSLGDVMKESASTALSYIKSNAKQFNINAEELETWNIHIHVPEGAIPKDGPSAGITLLTALVSLLQNKKIKPHLAMTGEITLRGKVLPVGGIKEKLLAAKRAGIKEVILCENNKKDVEEIEKDFLKGLKFHYVKTMLEVIDWAIK
jgi:ATP-dependent Lon protease